MPHDHHGHGDHGHSHADTHDHAHAHEHASGTAGHHHHDAGEQHAGQGLDHDHEATQSERAPLLERGEGAGKTLFFDAFSGVAGDMTIAALLDLGVPLLVIEQAVAALPLGGFHLHRGHVHRSGIVAVTFDVHLEGPQPERTYASIDAMLLGSNLESAVKDLARRIFRRLAEAEARVHRMPIDEVHFHEVGAVDAIVDIVGAAAAITFIGAEMVCSPLPMGHGFVKARHGILPLPAPAVVECLRGAPTYGVDIEAELVTPTGAAIVAAAAARFEKWPTLVPERVGFGGGSRELAERPNMLRVVLGSAPVAAAPLPADATHVVVEANVDDMTGELAAHAIEMLMAAGALDAWATPITMKKGRPALTISALSTAETADAVAAVLLRETTSIGLRRLPVTRIERPRRTIVIETPLGTVRAKVSEGPYGPPQIKPELDDCAALARTHGVPLREVLALALSLARARGNV